MTLLPPNKEQMRIIQEKMKERRIDMEKEVENLKNWISQQPHLPKYIDNNMKLENFISQCNYSLEKAKKTIDTYYTIRGLAPEFFGHRDPLHYSIRQALEVMYDIPLPKLTKDGYRVVLVGNTSQDIDKTVPEDVQKIFFMIGDVLYMENVSVGFVFVINGENCTRQQLMKAPISKIIKFIHCLQKGYPGKLKHFIMINTPIYFEYVLNVCKPFISKKILSRFKIYTKNQGYEPLYELLGRETLPSDFGGDAPSIQELRDDWRKKLTSYRDWFLREEHRLTDETKRPLNTNFDPDELFGMTGSFRQLHID